MYMYRTLFDTHTSTGEFRREKARYVNFYDCGVEGE